MGTRSRVRRGLLRGGACGGPLRGPSSLLSLAPAGSMTGQLRQRVLGLPAPGFGGIFFLLIRVPSVFHPWLFTQPPRPQYPSVFFASSRLGVFA